MKVVLYTSILPYPLNEGGKTAQFTFLKNLVRSHEVTLILSPINNNQIGDLDNLKITLPTLKVVVLKSDMHDVKKSFYIKLLEKLRWILKKRIKKNSGKNKQHENPFYTFPVKVKSEAMLAQILKVITEESPDVFQVDFIDNADIGLMVSKNQKKILVMHDIRFASVAQSANVRKQGADYMNYVSDFIKSQ